MGLVHKYNLLSPLNVACTSCVRVAHLGSDNLGVGDGPGVNHIFFLSQLPVMPLLFIQEWGLVNFSPFMLVCQLMSNLA